MTKNWKKCTSLSLHIGRSSYRRSLKREHPTLQNMKFLHYFLLLWFTFALLDPDPAKKIISDHLKVPGDRNSSPPPLWVLFLGQAALLYKVWWRLPHFFIYFCLFQYMHSESYSYNDTIQSPISIRRGLSPFPHCTCAQWGKPPWDAEQRFELGPALQQASALATEPRCTLD
jgi:hypothetical protein